MTTYGIGEFQMRNGGKAVVTDKDRQLTFPLAGYSGDRRLSWCRNGKRHADGGQSDFDLVAPWVEPAPDTADDELTALKAENERLRKALEPFGGSEPPTYETEYGGRTYIHCVCCHTQVSEGQSHDECCDWLVAKEALKGGDA